MQHGIMDVSMFSVCYLSPSLVGQDPTDCMFGSASSIGNAPTT